MVLLDYLDRPASLIWEQMTRGSAYKTFSSFILESSKVSQLSRHDDFLSPATVYGLSLYLAAKLSRGDEVSKSKLGQQYLNYLFD